MTHILKQTPKDTPFECSPEPTLSEEMQFLAVQIKEHVARLHDPDLDTKTFLQLMSDQMLDLMDRARQNEIASAQMTRMLKDIRDVLNDYQRPIEAIFTVKLMLHNSFQGIAA